MGLSRSTHASHTGQPGQAHMLQRQDSAPAWGETRERGDSANTCNVQKNQFVSQSECGTGVKQVPKELMRVFKGNWAFRHAC